VVPACRRRLRVVLLAVIRVVVAVRRLDLHDDERGLVVVQLQQGHVEVVLRRRFDAVGAAAEVGHVEVGGDDLVFVVLLLHLERQGRLFGLAVVGNLLASVHVHARVLLGDGGRALRLAAGEVVDQGARGAPEVDAAVLVELLVLERHQGLLDRLGDLVLVGLEAEGVAVGAGLGGAVGVVERGGLALAQDVLQRRGVLEEVGADHRDAGDEEDAHRDHGREHLAAEPFAFPLLAVGAEVVLVQGALAGAAGAGDAGAAGALAGAVRSAVDVHGPGGADRGGAHGCRSD
jgi:hypothetical protein